jgi:hypothetical protein
MNLDREQLEALKRQIEEEYKLDMAAIERLQRRFGLGNAPANGRSLASAPAVPAVPAYLAPVPEAVAAAPVVELPQERQPDELTGTLRAMFSGQRK